MDKILFICEGAKTEKKFCNLIIDKYFIKNNKPKDFVAFGTNIYGLYDEISKDRGLNIVELVAEKAKEKKDMYNYNKLSQGGFSEIYLIFDFDVQAPQYDYKKIENMIELFDNETEHGKLYVNYPMMESFKHFSILPDLNYNSYKVHKESCVSYKEYVGQISVIKHFGDLTEEKLRIIIKQNITKYEYISKRLLSNYNEYLKYYTQKQILIIQNELLKRDNMLYVLNTSVLWGIDYFGKEKYKEYYNIKI